MKELNIYFDYNATTPTDPRVVEAILPYFNSDFDNPSSLHILDQKIKNAVERSRSQISGFFNEESSEIIFTSGAIEAINLALKGIAETNYYTGKHVIITQTEHSAVLNVCKYFKKDLKLIIYKCITMV